MSNVHVGMSASAEGVGYLSASWNKTRFINLASVWKDERVFINPVGKLPQSSFISTNIGFLKGSLLSNEGDIKAVVLLIEAIVGQFA